MTNAWVQHVQKYRSTHKCSYKEALKCASTTWKMNTSTTVRKASRKSCSPRYCSSNVSEPQLKKTLKTLEDGIQRHLRKPMPSDPPSIDADVKREAEKLHEQAKKHIVASKAGTITKALQSVPLYTRMIKAIIKSLLCAVLYSITSVLPAHGVFAASIIFVLVFNVTMISQYADVMISFFSSGAISTFINAMKYVPLLGRLVDMLQKLFGVLAEYGPIVVKTILYAQWYVTLSLPALAGVLSYEIVKAALPKVRAICNSVAEYVAGYFGPMASSKMFSVIYLSIRGEYASAAVQASALAAGALSILCGEANLTCRSASVVLSIPGAAIAINETAQELVRIARIMHEHTPLEYRYCKACLGIDKDDGQRGKAPRMSSYDEALDTLGIHKNDYERASASEKMKILKRALRTQQQIHHPDKGGTHEASVKISNAFDALKDVL